MSLNQREIEREKEKGSKRIATPPIIDRPSSIIHQRADPNWCGSFAARKPLSANCNYRPQSAIRFPIGEMMVLQNHG